MCAKGGDLGAVAALPGLERDGGSTHILPRSRVIRLYYHKTCRYYRAGRAAAMVYQEEHGAGVFSAVWHRRWRSVAERAWTAALRRHPGVAGGGGRSFWQQEGGERWGRGWRHFVAMCRWTYRSSIEQGGYLCCHGVPSVSPVGGGRWR